MRGFRLRGTYESRIWQHDPTVYAPARYRQACAYDAFLPARLTDEADSLPPALVGTLSEAEQALLRAGSAEHRDLAPLARLLLRTESIASSKVEGLLVDARDLARGEARAETGGRVSGTVAEILANVDAMELAIDEATTATRFAPEHILAIHRTLMTASPRPSIAGRFRTTQNWIGGNDHNPCGADYVPPPPEHVLELIDDLCLAVDSDALPPLMQAALVHAQFETIHPFEDGNGRTGRALIHVVLRRRGLTPRFVPPISVVFSRNRGTYIEGLTRFREGGEAEWLETFASAAASAALLVERYVADVRVLQDRWRGALVDHSNPRADAAAWAIIDVLPAHPVITAPVAVAATGRAKSAIHAALEQLQEAGVLDELSGGRRNRSWEAVGLLDLIAELDA